MTHPLTPRRPGRAVTRFSTRALLAGGSLLGVLLLGGVLLPMAWQRSTPAVAKEQPPEHRLTLPEVISRPLPARVVPIAAPIVQDPAPIVQYSQPDTTPEVGQAVRQQSFLDTLNPFASQPPPAPKEKMGATQPPSTPTPPPPATKEAKPRKGWAVLATPTKREATAQGAGTEPERVLAEMDRAVPPQRGTTAGHGGQDLIHTARWAIPAEPLKTLYMSQTLAGRILDPLQSDLPGRIKIALTVPTFDKFGQGVTILPKDTLVIAQQVSVPQYGQTRLQVRLIQLELPGGEVVSLNAMVGDDQGTNGLSGRVNNHYGKLLLATGIAAVLNIGVQAAVGTPGPQEFFRSPVQDAAKDVGQGVQQEAQKVVDRELRVPPTITRKAGTFCVITLEENLQFNRPPMVAR